MSVTGLLVGWRIRSSLGEALLGYGLMVAFAFAMIWIGVLIGSLVRTPEGVQGIAFAALFPLTFVASTFVPVASMPSALRTVAQWNPITTLSDALRELFGNPNTPVQPGDPWSITHPVTYTLLWIAGIVLVCAPLAVRAYQRSVDS
jgi:ABC-type multidrug transport system permease subunit